MNIKEEKKALRRNFKMARLAMEQMQRQEMDDKILNRILQLWSYKEATTLFTYVSTEIEVDTRKLIRTALSQGKRVAVPYCIDHTCEMDFYYIHDFDDLIVRSFGVLEPKPGQCKKVQDLSNGLCIVPALAYDRSGYRLGYGKGYYDRFLNSFSGNTIGLIYTGFVVPKLPHGRFDQKVEILVSEKYSKPTAVL